MCLLRILGVVVVLRMNRRRHFVRNASHFFHDVDFAAHWPRIRAPVVTHRHHPESGPCAFSYRQLDSCLEIAIEPTLIHLCIHASRIDFSILFQAMNTQSTVLQLCHKAATRGFVIHIVLKLVVHPATVLHFVCPVVGIQFQAIVELIAPYERISFGRIVGGFLRSCLIHSDALASSSRHQYHSTRTSVHIGICRYFHAHASRRCNGVLSRDGYEVAVSVCTPFLTRGCDVDGVCATFGWNADGILRSGNRDGGRCQLVVISPTAAREGYGERK